MAAPPVKQEVSIGTIANSDQDFLHQRDRNISTVGVADPYQPLTQTQPNSAAQP